MSDTPDESTSEPYASDSCCICDKEFPSDLQLAKHLVKHSKEEEYKTLVSAFEEKTKPLASSFTCKENVSYKSKSVNKKSNSEVCEIVIDDSDDEKSPPPKPSIPLRSVRIVNSARKKSFLCPICSKVFNTDVNLRAHLVLHEKPRPYTCQFCKKSFSYLGRYRAHMQLHENEKKKPK